MHCWNISNAYPYSRWAIFQKVLKKGGSHELWGTRMRSIFNVHMCGVYCKNYGLAKQNDPAALKKSRVAFTRIRCLGAMLKLFIPTLIIYTGIF